MTAGTKKQILKFGDTVLIKGQNKTERVTGFFTNIENPEDPECNIFINDFTINDYQHLLVAEQTPDPSIYDSIEVVYDGGWASFEIDLNQIEKRVEDTDNWTAKTDQIINRNQSRNFVFDRWHNKK